MEVHSGMLSSQRLYYPPSHFLLHLFFKGSASLCIFGQCISVKGKNTARLIHTVRPCLRLRISDIPDLNFSMSSC